MKSFFGTILSILLVGLMLTIVVTLITILNVSAGYIVSHIFPLSLFDASLLCSIMAGLLLGVLYFLKLHPQDEDDEPTLTNAFRLMEVSKNRKRKKR